MSETTQSTNANQPPHRFRGVAWVLALFVISGLVRLPLLDRPLSANGEWLTSTVLRNLTIWEASDGVQEHKLLPVMTYPGDANRFIDNQAALFDDDGVSHFVSFPPFAYVAPHAVFSVLGVRPSVGALQAFGLAVHLGCALLVFQLVSFLAAGTSPRRAEFGGVFAAGVYVFAPVALWFHGNTYMAEIFVQLPFVAGVLIVARGLAKERSTVVGGVAAFVVTGLMCSTDWLGFTFAAVAAVIALMRRKPGLATAVVLGALASLALTTLHYGSIAGIDALFDQNAGKFAARSGYTDAAYQGVSFLAPTAWRALIASYHQAFTPVLMLAAGLAVLAVFLRRGTGNVIEKPWRDALVLCAAPVLLHHALLFNYTAVHNYATLKTTPLVAVVVGLLIATVLRLASERESNAGSERSRRRALLMFGLLCAALCVVSYRLQNRDGHDGYARLGAAIAAQAEDDHVVFLEWDRRIEPQLVWYAQRNLAAWESDAQAEELVRRCGAAGGIVMTVGPDFTLTRSRRF